MGIFNVFKKDTSPAELEERSRKEKEMARKYYEKGQRFGEKMGMGKAIEKANTFINRYPITFFAIVTAIMAGSYILNLTLVRMDFTREVRQDMETMGRLPALTAKDSLDITMNEMYREYMALAEKIRAITSKATLTAEDSLQAMQAYQRMLDLEEGMGIRSIPAAGNMDEELKKATEEETDELINLLKDDTYETEED